MLSHQDVALYSIMVSSPAISTSSVSKIISPGGCSLQLYGVTPGCYSLQYSVMSRDINLGCCAGQCDKALNEVGNLNKHESSHTGE